MHGYGKVLLLEFQFRGRTLYSLYARSSALGKNDPFVLG